MDEVCRGEGAGQGQGLSVEETIWALLQLPLIRWKMLKNREQRLRLAHQIKDAILFRKRVAQSPFSSQTLTRKSHLKELRWLIQSLNDYGGSEFMWNILHYNTEKLLLWTLLKGRIFCSIGPREEEISPHFKNRASEWVSEWLLWGEYCTAALCPLPAAFSNVCHVSIVAASYGCNVTIVSILCHDETSAAAKRE